MISGPGIIHHGAIDNATMAAYDVAPTLYEFAGIDASKSLSERPTLPMIGVSFKRYLTGESLHAPRTQYGVELHNQAAWIDGNGNCVVLSQYSHRRVMRHGNYSTCNVTPGNA